MADVQRPLHVVPIWRLVLGGLIVVGICSLLCWRWGWCWWCPDVDCCEPEPAAQIIVEDMHAAIWMPIENSSFHFDDPADPDDDAEAHEPTAVCEDASKAFGPCEGNYEVGDTYRHGVLYQTGPVVKVDDVIGVSTEVKYKGVYIVHDGGEDWLLAEEDDDFDWLDVIADGTKCVIDPENAYTLVHTADDKNIIDHLTGGHSEDVVANACDAPSTTVPPEHYCARNRSIHASVMATRIITYWSGSQDDFYEMVAKDTDEIPIVTSGGTLDPTHGDPQHVSYHFALPDEVVVDRWWRGCHEQRYTGVTLIRILHHDPPLFHLGYPHRVVDGEY